MNRRNKMKKWEKANMLKITNTVKLEIVVIIQVNVEALLEGIFHNGSNYNYQFKITELAEEFEGQLACLGENTEKHIKFLVPIEKEVKRPGKNVEEITKAIFYTLQFIDSGRFMSSSLSNLFESDIQYPEELYVFQNDLTFFL